MMNRRHLSILCAGSIGMATGLLLALPDGIRSDDGSKVDTSAGATAQTQRIRELIYFFRNYRP